MVNMRLLIVGATLSVLTTTVCSVQAPVGAQSRPMQNTMMRPTNMVVDGDGFFGVPVAAKKTTTSSAAHRRRHAAHHDTVAALSPSRSAVPVAQNSPVAPAAMDAVTPPQAVSVLQTEGHSVESVAQLAHRRRHPNHLASDVGVGEFDPPSTQRSRRVHSEPAVAVAPSSVALLDSADAAPVAALQVASHEDVIVKNGSSSDSAAKSDISIGAIMDGSTAKRNVDNTESEPSTNLMQLSGHVGTEKDPLTAATVQISEQNNKMIAASGQQDPGDDVVVGPGSQSRPGRRGSALESLDAANPMA